jgi:hypothetical protein
MVNRSILTLSGIAALAAAGCSTGPHGLTTGSGLGPATHGSIQVERRDDGYKNVIIQVRNLEKANMIVPDAAVYVVWLEPLQKGSRTPSASTAQNRGVLEPRGDVISKFETVTNIPRFRILVTAEPLSTTTQPTGSPVLWSDPVGEEESK